MSESPDEYEFLVYGGERRPKLSNDECEELQSRWQRRTFTAADHQLLQADFERALRKLGADVGTARRISASATTRVIFNFYSGPIADYASKARDGRSGGGFNARGILDAIERPKREDVLKAIRRLKGKVPDREIPRRVKDGGINLSVRQIRNIGQQYGLLPKGKR